MTVTPSPVVLGVFRDRALAEQAVDNLKQQRWLASDSRILGKSSGGVLNTLRNALAPRESTQEQTSDEFSQLDLPAEQRELYERELEHGSFIVLVHPQGHLLETRDLLNRYGAYQVFTPFRLGEEQTVHLRQEVPHVQKYVVDVGEIRIHKRIITEEKIFTVPVTREEVTIERLPLVPQAQPQQNQSQANPSILPPDNPAGQNQPQVNPSIFPPDSPANQMQSQTNRPALLSNSPVGGQYPPLHLSTLSSEDEVLRDGGVLRIRVRAEQVTIQKQPVVVEEIIVQKQMIEEVRHLVEPIRHEEARIERIGDVPMRENNSDE